MAHPTSHPLTPIKVRGRRQGIPAEKWNFGKRRNPRLQRRHAAPNRSPVSNPAPLPVGPREGKARDTHQLSPLEKLPTEVIQLIFEYSSNIELPLTSSPLASSLSNSHHLQHQLTTETLQPVLGHSARPSQVETARATRLLNSKFMTLQFFKAWLASHVATLHPATGLSNANSNSFQPFSQAWTSLEPLPSLLPPRKLLHPPQGFTPDSIMFLDLLTRNVTDLTWKDPAYGEIAYEGLVTAVRECNPQAVSLMIKIGVAVTTETLRVAVAECGCDEGIVRMLLCNTGHAHLAQRSSPHSEIHSNEGAIDLLDPELWAWAEKARMSKNPRGEWLVAELRNAQQRRHTTSET